MNNVDVELMLHNNPVPVDTACIEAIHDKLFGPQKREIPHHYEVHELLDRGSFGLVYEATDTRFPRKVALKIIKHKDTTPLASVEHEAHVLASLDHPNIVKVFDKGVVDVGTYYIAMELVPGVRLDRWMHDDSRSLENILRAFQQAARGLQYAHENGVVHRDFKPSNAIVDESGHLRILDFGLAQYTAPDNEQNSATHVSGRSAEVGHGIDDSVSHLPETQQSGHEDLTRRSSDWSYGDGAAPIVKGSDSPRPIAGTRGFIAPEQFDGHAADSRSDQFSLCVALYEACYGVKPFTGHSARAFGKRTTTASSSRRRVPRRLARLLRKGLSIDPKDRFTSLKEIADALDEQLTPRWSWTLVLGSVAASVLAALAVVRLMSPPTLSLTWNGAWPDDFDQTTLQERYDYALAQDLTQYERKWKGALDAYRSREDRANDSPEIQCLTDGKDEFRRTVQLLASRENDRPRNPTPLTPLTEDRIWVAHLFDPDDCLRGGSREAHDPDIATRLVEAQIDRFTGHYAEAADKLERVIQESSLRSGTRLWGLLHYELGLVQELLGDPEAFDSLEEAEADSYGDAELVVEALIHRLQVAIFVRDDVEKDEMAKLARRLERRANDLDDRHTLAKAAAMVSLAQLRTHEGDRPGAKEWFARAIQFYEGIPASARRDYMISYCVLQSAYLESWNDPGRPVDIDAEALDRALVSMGEILGETHPRLLRNSIAVAELLAYSGRPERGLDILSRVLKSLRVSRELEDGPEGIRARVWRLTLELETDGGSAESRRAWIQEAEDLATLMLSTPSGPASRRRERALMLYRLAEFYRQIDRANPRLAQLLVPIFEYYEEGDSDEICNLLEDWGSDPVERRELGSTMSTIDGFCRETREPSGETRQESPESEAGI